jgi:hypothetical protein
MTVATRQPDSYFSADMKQPTIERSNERGKFTESELRAKVKESKEFWASPAGRKAAAEHERRAKASKPMGVRFPDIASTKPTIATRSTSPASMDPRHRHCLFLKASLGLG